MKSLKIFLLFALSILIFVESSFADAKKCAKAIKQTDRTVKTSSLLDQIIERIKQPNGKPLPITAANRLREDVMSAPLSDLQFEILEVLVNSKAVAHIEWRSRSTKLEDIGWFKGENKTLRLSYPREGDGLSLREILFHEGMHVLDDFENTLLQQAYIDEEYEPENFDGNLVMIYLEMRSNYAAFSHLSKQEAYDRALNITKSNYPGPLPEFVRKETNGLYVYEKLEAKMKRNHPEQDLDYDNY